MIASLTGKIIDIESGNAVVIAVGGVGYQVFCTAHCKGELHLQRDCTVLIYTEVKEDAIRLYGFYDKLEKQVFLLLTLVKGIGPKSALDIVSKVPARDILRYIGSEDRTKLSAVKGLGRKTAERIIVELKDKVGQFAVDQGSSSLVIEKQIVPEPIQEAILALQALGFSKKDAERAVEQVADKQTLNDSGIVVREALRFI